MYEDGLNKLCYNNMIYREYCSIKAFIKSIFIGLIVKYLQQYLE